MNDRSYTKLFSKIVTSSMWSEDSDVRVVWVTMLALQDAYGEVHAAIPGLARAANVSLEKCNMAIKKFLAPDEWSRSKEFEGRRIEEIDGGWRLINADKYRRLMSEEERREYKRVKESERRARIKARGVSVDSHGHPVAEIPKNTQNVDSPSLSSSKSKSSVPQGESEGETLTAEDIYGAYPLKVKKPDALRAIKRAMTKVEPTRLLELTKAFAATRNGDLDFVPHPATWFNAEQFNDDPETWKPKTLSSSRSVDLRTQKTTVEEKIKSLLVDTYIDDQWVKRAKPGHENEVKTLRAKLREVEAKIVSAP